MKRINTNQSWDRSTPTRTRETVLITINSRERKNRAAIYRPRVPVANTPQRGYDATRYRRPSDRSPERRHVNQPADNLLTRYFDALDGVAVAFSGGVDSSLLLAVAHEALGDRVLAVSCRTAAHTDEELRDATDLAAHLGARHVVIDVDPLQDSDFRANNQRRCYFCKRVIFAAILAAAADAGITTVVEGSNADDMSDYRPGFAAVREMEVRSPFVELGIGKEQIRRLARERALPVWNRPATACLVSRLPYGEPITQERLRRVDRAEQALRAHGIWPARARDHGAVVRIEADPQAGAALFASAVREALVAELKAVGYTYVTVDLQGYRTGAMNETLSQGNPNDEPE